jgi:hypothetical protein
MASRGINNILIKPFMVAIICFFAMFFFFPSFSIEYLGVGYEQGSVDNSDKLNALSDKVTQKTGASLDDVVDAANSDALKNLLDSGLQSGQDAASKISDSVKGN